MNRLYLTRRLYLGALIAAALGFSCYQGGTIEESGNWKVARAG
jgi:hypothetical protein